MPICTKYMLLKSLLDPQTVECTYTYCVETGLFAAYWRFFRAWAVNYGLVWQAKKKMAG